MATGISREETTTEFGGQDFTEDNFELFAQQIDSSLTEYQITATFDSLVADGIDTFDAAFTALDTTPDGIVTSQEIKDGCGICQDDHNSEQMYDMAGTGTAMSVDDKNAIMDANNPDNIFGDDVTDADRAYLQEINIFSGEGLDEAGNLIGYNDAAQEAFRLIVDMYVNDSDFRDLIQYYIDTKGEGPTITMGELDSDTLGIGNINGTNSLIDITNILSDNPENKERAQETIAHELMHNLGLGHDTPDEETAFDAELESMFDMEDEGGSTSYEWHNYSTTKENNMPLLTETTEEDD